MAFLTIDSVTPRWRYGLLAAALVLSCTACESDDASQQECDAGRCPAGDGGSGRSPANRTDGASADAGSPPDAESGADATADGGGARGEDAGGGDGGEPQAEPVDDKDDVPACGDELTGEAVDEEPPTATVLFPSHRAYTDASSITVRGSAHDPDGVAAVSVGGVGARSTDGFATWTATVPLVHGCNVLPVTVTDSLGNQHEHADSLAIRNQGTPLTSVAAMAIDAANGQLLVADEYSNSILSFDLDSGYGTVLTSASQDDGTGFRGSSAIAVDATRDRALAGSWGDDTLLSVDLTTGERRVISTSQGEETQFPFVYDIALDAEADTAFVLNSYHGSVVAVDLASGARTVVSSEGVGAGPSLTDPAGIVFDDATLPSEPRLLVSDRALGLVLAVDIASGDRSVLSSTSPQGTGLALNHPSSIELDAANHRLLVVDGEPEFVGSSSPSVGRNVVIAVDLLTGDRTTVAGAGVGSGAPLSRLYGLAFDPGTQRLFVAGTNTGRIVRVDLQSGERERFVDSNVGSGPGFAEPAALAFDDGELWALDSLNGSLLRVELANGERKDVSSVRTGSGPPWSDPSALALDSSSGVAKRAFVLELLSNSVFTVDLGSGERALLSDSGETATGAGNFPGLAFDAAHDRLLFTEATSFAGLQAIDMQTGVRSTFAGADGDATVNLRGAQDVVIDDVSTPARALVIANQGVIGVDLSTGALEPVSSVSLAVGEGAPFFGGRGALDRSARALVATDTFSGVFTIDLASGQREQVCGTDPAGGPGVRPAAVAVDGQHRIAYVADDVRHCIMAVDLSSGERVIMSR